MLSAQIEQHIVAGARPNIVWQLVAFMVITGSRGHGVYYLFRVFLYSSATQIQIIYYGSFSSLGFLWEMVLRLW